MRKIVLVVAVLAVLGAAAWWWRARSAAPASPGEALAARLAPGGRPAGPAQALPVDVVRLAPRTLRESLQVTGTVLADEEVAIQAEVPGRLVELGFVEGQRVAEGTVLFRQNDAELRAQLARTRVRRELALTQERRLERLFAEQGVAADQLDAARNETRVLEAEIALIEAQIDRTVFRAPFAGIASLRLASPGAFLSPGTLLATLVRTDPVKVQFSVPERHRPRVAAGRPIRFTVPGIASSFAGEIFAIDPRVDEATRTVAVRARAANADGALRPGGLASIEVTLAEIPDALLVPANALVPGFEQQAVFVARDGRAVRRVVRTGQRLAAEVQVVEGLSPGDEVIVSSLLALREGLPITVARVLSAAEAPSSRAPAAVSAAPSDGPAD